MKITYTQMILLYSSGANEEKLDFGNRRIGAYIQKICVCTNAKKVSDNQIQKFIDKAAQLNFQKVLKW